MGSMDDTFWGVMALALLGVLVSLLILMIVEDAHALRGRDRRLPTGS
jgi:hypothetical protein